MPQIADSPKKPYSTNPKRVHVISRDQGKGWVVFKEGFTRALSRFDKKEDAVREARKFLDRGYDVVIHRTNASVEEWLRAKV